jgi:hypothetical protein
VGNKRAADDHDQRVRLELSPDHVRRLGEEKKVGTRERHSGARCETPRDRKPCVIDARRPSINHHRIKNYATDAAEADQLDYIPDYLRGKKAH